MPVRAAHPARIATYPRQRIGAPRVGQPAISQQRVRHVEAIHRHQARLQCLPGHDRQAAIVLFPVPEAGQSTPAIFYGSPLSAGQPRPRRRIDEACVPPAPRAPRLTDGQSRPGLTTCRCAPTSVWLDRWRPAICAAGFTRIEADNQRQAVPVDEVHNHLQVLPESATSTRTRLPSIAETSEREKNGFGEGFPPMPAQILDARRRWPDVHRVRRQRARRDQAAARRDQCPGIHRFDDLLGEPNGSATEAFPVKRRTKTKLRLAAAPVVTVDDDHKHPNHR